MPDFHDSLDAALEQTAPWSDRDLHIERPDVPGHAMRLEAAGRLFVVACECGERSEATHLSNLTAARNRHRIAAAVEQPQRHDLGLDESASGKYVRLVCSCGHKGPWRARASRLLDRQLHSDDGGHLYAVRRGEA